MKAQRRDILRLSGMKIIYAEDSIVQQFFMQPLYDKLRIKVHMVMNGKELVKEFKKNPKKYDAIVTDIHMPILDGVEAIT